MKIHKVSIKQLLDLFTNIYERGVDYIDIEGVRHEEDEEDTLLISFREEYVNPDMIEEFKEKISELEEFKKITLSDNNTLSDDDIEQLL